VPPRIRRMLRRLRRSRPVGDFNVFLHELRSRELERLPPGARTVLHGGCAGSWYFEWFEERYPSTVDRHIGVEAFAPRPNELGSKVEWLERSLGDLGPVRNAEVDLVFAGQVIEHLWPEEIVGFLLESHRVLRPGGVLAVDSPNRRVTTAIGWEHPEHTVEFRPDEILELFQVAGFEQARIRGVWLCFDRERNRFLSLEGGPGERRWSPERRAAAAEERPEDSFVWWIEAVRGDGPSDPERLSRRVQEIYELYRRSRFGSLKHTVGAISGVGHDRIVTAGLGEAGQLVYGPYVPMKAGRWVARFRVGAGPADTSRPYGLVDVVTGADAEVVASQHLTPDTLALDGALHEFSLPFELARAELGVQFRVQSYGAVQMCALLHVDIQRPNLSASETGSEDHLETARA
jgi:SAM-dependent methyltransferase